MGGQKDAMGYGRTIHEGFFVFSQWRVEIQTLYFENVRPEDLRAPPGVINGTLTTEYTPSRVRVRVCRLDERPKTEHLPFTK